MRSILVLIGLAAVAPAQLIPAAEIASLAIPSAVSAPVGVGNVDDVVTYDPAAAYDSAYNAFFSSPASRKRSTPRRASMLDARHTEGDCSPQPLGSGPVPDPDTPDAFVNSPAFAQAATSAPVPAGYAQTFSDLDASIQSPMGYLGYTTLTSYDTNQCAALCDAKAGCEAFNIYFERDATLDPGPACPNPPSTTVIKCAFWGTAISPDMATNTGQYCADFHIVIAGSNGYVKRSAVDPVPGYNGTFLGDAAINAPHECASYITYKLFNDGLPFDVNRCAAACQAESAYNIQYLNSRAICRFFNTYILLKNGIPQGQYCALYTRSWDISYATNFGYTYNGDVYTIIDSVIYSNSTDPGANICVPECRSQYPCPIWSSSLSSSTPTPTTPVPSSSSTSLTVTSPITTTTPTSPITSPTTPIGTTTIGTTTTPTSVTSASTTHTGTTTPISTTTTPTTSSGFPTTHVSTTATHTTFVTSSRTRSSGWNQWTTTTTEYWNPWTTTTTNYWNPWTTTTTNYWNPWTTTSAFTHPDPTTTIPVPIPTPTPTGPCFKIRCPSLTWLQSNYLIVDSSQSRLSYTQTSSNPSAIFYADRQGYLRSANDNSLLMRSAPNIFTGSLAYGYISRSGSIPVSVSKSADSNALSLSSAGSASAFWASTSDAGLLMGSHPSSGTWVPAAMTYENCVCPDGANVPY